jgi:hypothetical protein
VLCAACGRRRARSWQVWRRRRRRQCWWGRSWVKNLCCL